MQVKKDHIQKAITEAAMTEFARYGYKQASMRRLAAKAGTQMSNIYNYFKGKEDMFAFIVGDHYNTIQDCYMKAINGQEVRISFRDIRDTKLLRNELRRWLSQFDPLFDKRTMLLLTASEGTRFTGAREEMIRKTVLAIGKACGWYPTPPDPEKYPLSVFADRLFDDVAFLYRKYEKDPELKQIIFNRIITEFIGFFIMTT